VAGWPGWPPSRSSASPAWAPRTSARSAPILPMGAEPIRRRSRSRGPLAQPGQLVLADRGFDGNAFFADIDRTGAMLLARAKSARNLPVVRYLPDGSYLSCLDGLDMRIIDADVAMTGVDGSRVTDSYRLITTLTDHHRYPAADLIRLYHERWEIESAFLALRHTLLNGRVLRSGDRPGIEQELWALLMTGAAVCPWWCSFRAAGCGLGSRRGSRRLPRQSKPPPWPGGPTTSDTPCLSTWLKRPRLKLSLRPASLLYFRAVRGRTQPSSSSSRAATSR
jgi:hypothetical protein